MADNFARPFSTFAGPDVQAMFNNIPFADLQHLQYSIAREKARIYTMGSADPRSISRGKRSIGGAFVFIMFDRSALLSAYEKHAKTSNNPSDFFYISGDEIKTTFDPSKVNTISAQLVGTGLAPDGTVIPESLNLPEADSYLTASNFFSTAQTEAWYVDQIPPFMVSAVAANEYGGISTLKFFDVELLEEGSGVGIDDIVIEQQYSFLCLAMQPWTPVRQSAQGFGVIPTV